MSTPLIEARSKKPIEVEIVSDGTIEGTYAQDVHSKRIISGVKLIEVTASKDGVVLAITVLRPRLRLSVDNVNVAPEADSEAVITEIKSMEQLRIENGDRFIVKQPDGDIALVAERVGAPLSDPERPRTFGIEGANVTALGAGERARAFIGRSLQ